MNKLFDRTTKAGFTLVELIVVIAILGILAGIAVPVYSGYIKKANKAADLQLLDAVNTAFAAATLENGIDAKNVTNATLAGDKKITGIASFVGGGATLSEVDDSFQKYFAGNADTELKYYESASAFVFKNGIFVESGVKNITAEYDEDNNTTKYTVTLENGKTASYSVSDDDKSAVNDSTFGSNMSMGELMGDISSVVDAAVGVLGGQVNREDYATEEDYKDALALAEQAKKETLSGILGSDYLISLGLSDEEGHLKDGVTSSQLGNALVLMVAKNTGSSTTTALNNAIQGGGLGALIGKDGLTSPETLANVAAAYGLMTGYANSEIGRTTKLTYTDENGHEKTSTVYDYFSEASVALSNSNGGGEGLSNVVAMMGNVMNSPGIDEYMGASVDDETGETIYAQNSQAIKDLAGYISAMNVISSNSDTIIKDNGVLSTGFDNTDLVAILNGILGN